MISDTWAHQDWAAVRSKINTYWDIDKPRWSHGTYGIKYKFKTDDRSWSDPELDWHYRVLGRRPRIPDPIPNMNRGNILTGTFGAMFRGDFAEQGHAWMGHLPDYSFIKYQYRPYWIKNRVEHERNNPEVFFDAFYDLYNFLHLTGPNRESGVQPLSPDKEQFIKTAIETGWYKIDLSNVKKGWPRVFSADAWRDCLSDLTINHPPKIETLHETGEHAELEGGEESLSSWTKGRRGPRYGTFTMEIMNGELPTHFYLFQLAADYHFQYVKAWLRKFRSYDLTDRWSKQPGPLGAGIEDLVNRRVNWLIR